MPITTFLLCRHGQSQWNAQGRVQGQSPAAGGLTELGRREAHHLGQRLLAARVDVLISSDLRRAHETAMLAGAPLHLTPQLDPRWREINLGQWQGLTRAEVAAGWPDADTIFEQDLPRGETGETAASVRTRTQEALHDLAARYPGQTIAVVCHGGNVRAALMLTPPVNGAASDPRRASIPNASLTLIEHRQTGLHARLIADTSHLAGLPLEPAEAADA